MTLRDFALSALKLAGPRLALAVGILLVCAGIVHSCKPEPVVTVRRVTTVDTVYRNVPVVRTSIVERLVYQRVPAKTVLVSVPHTDTLFQHYCNVAIDTTAKPLLLLSAGRYDGTSLALWGPRTDGSAYHGSARLRAPFEFTVAGDSVAFAQRRLPGLKLSTGQVLGSFVLGVATGYLGYRVTH